MLTKIEKNAIHEKKGENPWSSRFALGVVFFVFLFIFNVVNPNFSTGAGDWAARTAQSQMKLVGQGEGSIFNQLYWMGLLAVGIILVLVRPSTFLRNLSGSIPLLILMTWGLISIIWAEYSIIVFRRSSFLVVSFLTLYIGIAYSGKTEIIVKAAYLAAFAALFMDIYSLSLPSAYHTIPSLAGDFKGIHGHKNTAGLIAAMAIFLGLLVRPRLTKRYQVHFNSAFILGWAVLLLLSASKTSIVLVFLSPTLVYFAFLAARMFKLSIGLVLFINIALLTFSLTMLYASTGISLNDILSAVAGGEVTLTGRTDLWLYMADQIQRNWLLGYGYGGFWGLGLESEVLSTGSGWMRYVNQSHNGYIDVIVNMGAVGAILLFAVLSGFARQMERVRKIDSKYYYLLWTIMTFILLHNLTESSFVRTTHPAWIMMLFVLLISARIVRENSRIHSASKAFNAPPPPQNARP